MNCNPKTMLKVAAGLGAVLVVAYFALPQARALVLAGAPVLLALICPATMLLMAFTMKGKAGSASCDSTPSESAVPEQRREADPKEGQTA